MQKGERRICTRTYVHSSCFIRGHVARDLIDRRQSISFSLHVSHFETASTERNQWKENNKHPHRIRVSPERVRCAFKCHDGNIDFRRLDERTVFVRITGHKERERAKKIEAAVSMILNALAAFFLLLLLSFEFIFCFAFLSRTIIVTFVSRKENGPSIL